MQHGKRKRYLMAMTGVMPAVAITAGLLVLPPESVTRQQYLPWLPLLVLAVGLVCSVYFWLFAVGRADRNDSEKQE